MLKKLLSFGILIPLLITLIAFSLIRTTQLKIKADVYDWIGYFANTQNNVSASVKSILLPAVGPYESQYSPFLLYFNGWNSKLIYYCKDTVINNIAADRVWRAEISADLKTLLDNRAVISGTYLGDDDLSCSPGVIVMPDGTWHMYYVTTNRNTASTLFLYHATAKAPGVTWTKLGKVGGAFPEPANGYMESPSPILVNNLITLYFVGGDKGLYRATSSDGQNFSAPQKMNAPISSSGHVIAYGGNYYYVYAVNPQSQFQGQPPTEIRIAASSDGINFSNLRTLIQIAPGQWDASHVWSPTVEFNGNQMNVYYAGNSGQYATFLAASAIGYQQFLFMTPPTLSPSPQPSGQVTGQMVELYRFWSSYFKDYYLSYNASEITALQNAGWTSKTLIGKISPINVQNTVPLYTLWSDFFKDHYYTTSDSEKTDLINHGWRYDGILGYISNVMTSQTIPLFKTICGTTPTNHYYLFTTNTVERDNAVKSGCLDGGITGYLFN